MQNVDLIIVFIGIALLSFLFYRNSTNEADKMLRYNPKLCRNNWSPLPRKLRKLLFLAKKRVAKYVLIRFYFAILHVLLGVFNTILFICTNGNEMVAGILIMLQVGWIIIDSVVLVIYLYIYKNK